MMKNIFGSTKEMVMGSHKGPEGLMTRSYLIALTIIGLLTILTHGITTRITAAQQFTADINYNLSRQRANIQQVVLYAKRHQESRSIIDKEFLMQAVSEIENSYKQLYSRGDVGDKNSLNSPVLEEFFFDAPYHMHNYLGSFVKTSKEIIDPPANLVESDIEERVQLIEDQATQRLVRAFDVVHEFYQRESSDKIAELYKMQSTSVIFIICVLFIEAIFIFRPLVVKLSKYHKKLIRLALEDPLTGLNNRRAFISKSTAGLRQSVNDSKPASVVLCDLDKFKNVNDTYGHDVGDQVLKHFSKLLSSSLRSRDVIGRIGGEEFAILLPNCAKEEAFLIIDRFRETVANTPCGYSDDTNRKQTLSYTGSFGVITNTGAGTTIEHLLSAADKNLYDAKEKGRNKVVASALVEVISDDDFERVDTNETPKEKTTGAVKYPKTDSKGKPLTSKTKRKNRDNSAAEKSAKKKDTATKPSEAAAEQRKPASNDKPSEAPTTKQKPATVSKSVSGKVVAPKKPAGKEA